jgi:hypothetical protein
MVTGLRPGLHSGLHARQATNTSTWAACNSPGRGSFPIAFAKGYFVITRRNTGLANVVEMPNP